MGPLLAEETQARVAASLAAAVTDGR